MSIDPFEGAIPDGSDKEAQVIRASDFRYAGFWIRFIASVIDTILVSILIAPLIRFFFSHNASVSTSVFNSNGFSSYNFESLSAVSPLGNLIYTLVVLIVVVSFWLYRSATPGKMLLNLKIVDAKTGAGLTPGQSIIRYLGYFVSTLFFCMGFIWAGFDPRKQAWHDKMAGTYVVYADKVTKSPD